MLKAVVFDMDDTLLSINLSAFLAIFAKDESKILADIGRKNPLQMFGGFAAAMLGVNEDLRDDNDTNLAYFNKLILRNCGIPLEDETISEALRYYEREILPGRNDSLINARPREGAHEAVEAVLDHGLRIALLTNPSFSEPCIRARMGWGEMLDMPFELITTMENSTRCKPSPIYYLESLEKMGLQPHEVLMVGNDVKRDFPTPYCGIQTAYVGAGKPTRATWCGPMSSFAPKLDLIIDLFDQKDEQTRRSYREPGCVSDYAPAHARRQPAGPEPLHHARRS